MTPMEWAIRLGWPVFCAVTASLTTWEVIQQQRARDLAMRPPIAVISVASWMQGQGEGEVTEARMAEGMEQARLAIRKLQDQGVLVLDARAVRGGPQDVMLSDPRGP